MLKSALIAVAVLAVAAPGLAVAKGKKAAEESVQGPAAPIPYAQLAEEDAKLNGGAKAAKPAKKKGAKKAAAEAPAADASAAPAK
jgi:hypothetical protein